MPLFFPMTMTAEIPLGLSVSQTAAERYNLRQNIKMADFGKLGDYLMQQLALRGCVVYIRN